MAKNIVICCDGTGNEFGNNNSNVVKLYRVLQQDSNAQVTYYHPGIGTMGAPGAWSKAGQAISKFLGKAFGAGVLNNLADAYTYLMYRFEPDDKVFIYGFSRGAYTAKALAACLRMFGLVRKGNEVIVPYVMSMFKAHDFSLAHDFKATFSHDCKPYFVGLWDAVSSVGWIRNPLKLPYTAYDPDLAHGRHALSIDERRAFFRQNLWVEKSATQDIKQVWFAGVHSDIGGGYCEQQSGLAKITLEWMLRESEAVGLLVNQNEKDIVLGKVPGTFVPPDPLGPIHNSLSGFWKILEYFPHSYIDMSTGSPVKKWKMPRGRPRFIADGSRIHQAVFTRINSLPDYRPPNLPPKYEIEE